jgi:hypothetical protein
MTASLSTAVTAGRARTFLARTTRSVRGVRSKPSFNRNPLRGGALQAPPYATCSAPEDLHHFLGHQRAAHASESFVPKAAHVARRKFQASERIFDLELTRSANLASGRHVNSSLVLP